MNTLLGNILAKQGEKMGRKTPTVSEAAVYAADLPDGRIRLDTPEWFAWLAAPTTISFSYPIFDPSKGYIVGWLTVRKELRRNERSYWWIFRRQDGRVRKIYLGRSTTVTEERLNAIARQFLEAPSELVGEPAQTRPAAP